MTPHDTLAALCGVLAIACVVLAWVADRASTRAAEAEARADAAEAALNAPARRMLVDGERPGRGSVPHGGARPDRSRGRPGATTTKGDVAAMLRDAPKART